jgi:hypothetical protein
MIRSEGMSSPRLSIGSALDSPAAWLGISVLVPRTLSATAAVRERSLERLLPRD